jgi:acetylornithine deacetylase/succinyl-diaminopimelate desuccinylase-like protein
MKGGLAAFVVAAKKLVDLPLGGSLTLTFVSDEEMHSRGCDALIKSGKLNGIDACISAEPSGLSVLELGRRGRIVYEVNVKGQAEHIARTIHGINAVEEASRLILQLRKLPLGVVHDVKGSVEVLAMSGGTEFLTVPDSCNLLIDRHLVPGESGKEALKQMKKLVKDMKPKAKFEVKLFKKPTPFMEPYLLDGNISIVMAIEEACFNVRGVKPRKRIGLSAGDENYLVMRAGIPTGTLGPMGGNVHEPNEWTDLRSVAEATNIYVNVASIVLGSQG